MRLVHVLSFLAALVPVRAYACGGVFCDGGVSQPQPVKQTGERILFARDRDGRQLAYIQIAYQGQAGQFSWILPVVGTPKLSVGTDQLFTLLDQATAPTVGQTVTFDNCEQDKGEPFDCGSEKLLAREVPLSGGFEGDGTGSPPPTSYKPLGQGRAGPYDYAVLPGTSASDALTWLEKNGYYAPPDSAQLLRPYLDGQHNLLALRLDKDADVGQIVPVVVRSDEAQPCVPLHLTAVAAQDDMAVLVWVLGEARAVPANYASVEPNLARLDFPRGGGNYDALVSEAIDASPGGEGFVTEFAGKTPTLAAPLYDPGRDSVDDLRAKPDAVSYVSAVWIHARVAGWGTAPAIALLEKWFPEPDSLKGTVTPEQFAQDPTDFSAAYGGLPFDSGATTDDIDATFVAPLRDTQDLLDSRPYLTRLYTRISPAEMLDDPIFTENHDLPDVSNQLVAATHIVCDGKPAAESPARLDLPDGRQMWFTSQTAMNLPLGGPAARRVVRTSATGPGNVLLDNGPTIDAGHGDPRGCGGCRSAGGGWPWAMVAMALLLPRLARRKSRR